MKELDALLTAYLDEQFDAASDTDKAAFQTVLELPDPQLVGYLLQRQMPETESIARVIQCILQRAPT